MLWTKDIQVARRFVLSGAGKHIRHLCRLCIRSVKSNNERISNLLASYAEQLEYCYVKDMDEIELATITSACKNVRFSAMVSTQNGVCTTLKVLGRQLEKLRVTFDG